jgi:NAD-dependent deacetylase
MGASGAPACNNREMQDIDDAAVDSIRIAREMLARSGPVMVLTGAGISTDSGIPDFRGPQGLWTKNPAAEKMATLQHYMAEPEVRVASWKAKLESNFGVRRPNPGHLALADLEQQGRLDTLITQNVDGLHHKAGNSPERIVEIHGTVREVVCMECDDRRPMESALARVRAGETDPPCSKCGGILKSATISFGQGLVGEDLERSEQAALSCDLAIAVGSTLSVYPIANVIPIAKNAGARVIIINGGPTEMDAIADIVLRGSISELLPVLVADLDANAESTLDPNS